MLFGVTTNFFQCLLLTQEDVTVSHFDPGPRPVEMSTLTARKALACSNIPVIFRLTFFAQHILLSCRVLFLKSLGLTPFIAKMKQTSGAVSTIRQTCTAYKDVHIVLRTWYRSTYLCRLFRALIYNFYKNQHLEHGTTGGGCCGNDRGCSPSVYNQKADEISSLFVYSGQRQMW